MIRKIAAIALLATLAFAPGAALHAQANQRAPGDTLLAGYWQIKASVLLVINDTDYRCLTPQAEADAFLTEGPCKNHTKCVYPTNQVGDGKAKYVGYWEDRHGKRTTVRAEGKYTPQKLELNANIQGIPPGKITATWKGATCPAGAKH